MDAGADIPGGIHRGGGGVNKARVQLELELARDLKGDRRGFCENMKSRRKAKRSVGSLRCVAGTQSSRRSFWRPPR